MKAKLQYAATLLGTLVLVIGLMGCTGLRTFNQTARAGDTISLALGYQQDLRRDNITVEITDFDGVTTLYGPNDPGIQMVLNMYIDPISELIVGRETGLTIGENGDPAWGMGLEGFTNGFKDFSETTAFIQLPQSMAEGVARIQVRKDGVNLIPTLPGSRSKLTVDIVGAGGTPQEWTTSEIGPLDAPKYRSLERASHAVITFTGSTVPYAIQLSLSHDPDFDNGGIGRPFVTSPRGDLVSIVSHDTGEQMEVILMPVQSRVLSDFESFKFYVAGDITGWNVIPGSVAAFDANGGPVSGVVANLVTQP